MNYILYTIYAILVIGPIYLFWAISNINKKMRKIEWLNSQEYTILRIDVPRNNDKAPLAAEQMFAAIHGIYSESADYQNHLSFEIVAKDKFIQFYIYLPVHLKDFVEGQIYAQYPTVEIQEVTDYAQEVNISEKNFSICELGLNKPDVYPIKNFTDFEVDPISGITSVMSKLNSGEEVWFQLAIRPVGDDWQERGHSMVNSVRSGKKAGSKSAGNKILNSVFNMLKMILVQAIKPGAEVVAAKDEVKLPASVEAALKAIEEKITKLGFESKIRILTLSDDPVSAKIKCQSIGAAFKQFNTINLNGFKVGEIKTNDATAWKDFVLRSFESNGNIFNIAELASIFHLPHSSVATPNIVWSGSKKGEPPANLPLRENIAEADFTVIGESNFRNVYKEFGIKRDDRRRHIYIVGKSGTGKSTLIENMAVNDVNAGRGVIAVDPHGELADKILACIPDDRIKDVVMFDPSDREFPVAFNLLESVDDDFKGLVASGFVGIFKKIFGDSWGPRLEHILRNTVLALLDYENSTMLDIPKMLTNNAFRESVVEKVKDMVIKDFWMNEFAQYDAKFRTEAVSPILNKIGQFLSSSTIRNIVGQPKSRINIREIMDQQKILVVNLSRGKIGEDNSALLGAMMITKIQLAAMSRADVTVDKRPDCYLYVDEFQNFATESFSTILSEARKYNLCLTMAHQYIAQMLESVQNAVFGNAGTIISFRVGSGDADVLVKEYEPVFQANDLVNLDKHQIYVKLLIDGISCPAFSARTLPPVQKLSGNIDKVIAYSHEHYSNSRSAIEQDLEDRKREEEDKLRMEAEMFKKGGLEALLLKKNTADTSTVDVKTPPVSPSTAVLPTPNNTVESSRSDHTVILNKSTESVDPVAQNEPKEEVLAEKKPQEPRTIKLDNILYGKLYKERTARAGIKWYVGEEIDEEKLAKSGVIIDDKGRKMIELSARVAKKSENNTVHKNNQQNSNSNNQKKFNNDTVVEKNKTDELIKSESAKQSEDEPVTVINKVDRAVEEGSKVKSLEIRENLSIVPQKDELIDTALTVPSENDVEVINKNNFQQLEQVITPNTPVVVHIPDNSPVPTNSLSNSSSVPAQTLKEGQSVVIDSGN